MAEEEAAACVLDNGSGMIKAGFSPERTPKVIIPSMSIDSPSDVPIERGHVKNWDAMEKLWQKAYQELKVDPKDHPVLLTHAPVVEESEREKMLEVIFEKFEVPSMFLGVQSVLALYAAGLMDGFVLESGFGVTHAVPCDKGFALPANTLRLDLAGQDLTLHLMKTLNMSGYAFKADSAEDVRVLQDIKEKLCCVSVDSQEPNVCEYKLPDGQTIKLGIKRSQCPEALFNPTLAGVDSPGIHHLVNNAIQKCDASLHAKMYKNIVLAGGNTLFPGIKERLEKELQSLAPQGATVEVLAPPSREHSVWVGGSILCALPTFKDLLITKQAYKEKGTSIVAKIE